MKVFTKVSLLITVLFFYLPAVFAAPVFGRYLGTLKNDALNREQLAKLDFVTYRSDSSQLELRATLTLHFGAFNSSEYASYHFDKVRYNVLTSALVFDQADQDVTFVVKSFDGSTIKGELRSALSGTIGTIQVVNNGTAQLTRPAVEALQGQYRGECEGKESVLQVHTYRSGRDTNRTGNPFPYDIFAQRSIVDPLFCSRNDDTGEPEACVENTYSMGSYQFFTGQLDLFGLPNSVSCLVEGNSIVCGECRYQREKGFTLSSSRTYALPTSKPIWQIESSNSGSLVSLKDEYKGYLHHEYSNTYQPMSLNVVSFQDPDAAGGSLRLSAVARLFFGEINSSESIAYRFSERSFPIGMPVTSLVFFRPEADVDATLQITKVTQTEIQGVWNSLIFGRVGTFVARKGADFVLPQSVSRMNKLSNQFSSGKFDLSLLVRLGDAPFNSENPFAPLQFGGFVKLREGGANEQILEGTFDFFTGKIGLKYGNETGRVMVGWRDTNGLRLAKPSNGWNTRMQPFEPTYYGPR